jgi:FtsP/CotA-like multicopper oxidase with cupredoxin domain
VGMDMDRRGFLALGGGMFFCTLAGQKISADEGQIDVDKHAKGLAVPPKVAAAEAAGAGGAAYAGHAEGALGGGTTELAAFTVNGPAREYWIQAEPVEWDIVPTGRDQMMDMPIKGKTKFTAWAYRAYTPNFKKPLGPAKVPGPLLEVSVGETLVVHFRNKLKSPVTMHPHGIFYSNEMDGGYKGKFTEPGGFVQHNRTFTYVWEAKPGTEGTWLYHDHGPMDPLPVFKGLFGPLVIRAPGEQAPEAEFFLGFHAWEPPITGLKENFSCINGRAYAGNTPDLHAKVGQRVGFHVYGLDNFFHTFHLHGHRWTEPDGSIVDTKTFGPADSFRLEFVEDNPGRWFYHCHVFTHFHMGMNGWYIVD